MRTLVIVVLLGCLAAAQTPLAPQTTKLLVVTTPGWKAVDGTLTRYQRRQGKWRRVGRSVPVVVGKAGMAWDPRLARADSSLAGPVKQERDKRSPAGIFPVTRTFGFTPAKASNHVVLTETTECVDDSNSTHYTQVLDRGQTADVDWNSSEHMRSITEYRWGAVVGYNLQPAVPGNGSCIFLHVWDGPRQGTSGCTAMPERAMKDLVRWIGPGTLLVQMPAEPYQALQTAWGLPEFRSKK